MYTFAFHIYNLFSHGKCAWNVQMNLAPEGLHLKACTYKCTTYSPRKYANFIQRNENVIQDPFMSAYVQISTEDWTFKRNIVPY